MSNTIFNREHNRQRDRAFLTQLFRKWTVLGEDADGQINAKRVLTLFNARFCAKEILRQWRGLSGEALDAVVESDQFEKTFKEFDYQNNGTIDQKDAYFWASKVAGEQYEGVVSSER